MALLSPRVPLLKARRNRARFRDSERKLEQCVQNSSRRVFIASRFHFARGQTFHCDSCQKHKTSLGEGVRVTYSVDDKIIEGLLQGNYAFP